MSAFVARRASRGAILGLSMLAGLVVGAITASVVIADIPCYGGNCFGNDQDNTMWGTDGEDFIFSYGGQDRIHARAENDEAYGGNGHDRIEGEGGDDVLLGQGGNDQYSCPPNGNCGLMGGGGADWIQGHEGQDVAWGGPNPDHIEGNADPDGLVAKDDAVGDYVHGGDGGGDYCGLRAEDYRVGCEYID